MVNELVPVEDLCPRGEEVAAGGVGGGVHAVGAGPQGLKIVDELFPSLTLNCYIKLRARLLIQYPKCWNVR